MQSAPSTESAARLAAPVGLLAELTHRCPLQCPYCSNPLALERVANELPTEIWLDVLAQAAELGVLQPADLRAELRPYQRDGVRWLCLLRDAGLGALLADDMGLGKTLQALCAMRGRTLVVCPTSVAPNWMSETRRFRPDLSVALYHGTRRALDAELGLQRGRDIDLREYSETLARERSTHGGFCLGPGKFGGRLDGAHVSPCSPWRNGSVQVRSRWHGGAEHLPPAW